MDLSSFFPVEGTLCRLVPFHFIVRSFHSFRVKFNVKRAFFLVSGLKNEVYA